MNNDWTDKGLERIHKDFKKESKECIIYVEDLIKRISSKFKISKKKATSLIKKASKWNVVNEKDIMWVIENKLL